jgi:2-dehydro-3-deoxyphosphogluconate aldolase / (4S)-4-hydroxy-2-oxoglutarate aldolase
VRPAFNCFAGVTRTKSQVIESLLNPGVIAVVRARSFEQIAPLTEALLAGGLRAIEITMTTPNAIKAIAELKHRFSSALIGVGTVLNPQTCREAIAAGAEFVVSPITRAEIAAAAHEADRPVMLGAYTPTEAQTAFEAGADFIKLFPADSLGPSFIRALRAPLPHLKIVPTGGVTVENIGGFFQAGCAAVGAGSSLISGSVLEKNDWKALTRVATAFVSAARMARSV